MKGITELHQACHLIKFWHQFFKILSRCCEKASWWPSTLFLGSDVWLSQYLFDIFSWADFDFVTNRNNYIGQGWHWFLCSDVSLKFNLLKHVNTGIWKRKWTPKVCLFRNGTRVSFMRFGTMQKLEESSPKRKWRLIAYVLAIDDLIMEILITIESIMI